jgi:hypothetical protein
MRPLTHACRDRAAAWAELAADDSFTEEQLIQFRELSESWEGLAGKRDQSLPIKPLAEQPDGASDRESHCPEQRERKPPGSGQKRQSVRGGQGRATIRWHWFSPPEKL